MNLRLTAAWLLTALFMFAASMPLYAQDQEGEKEGETTAEEVVEETKEAAENAAEETKKAVEDAAESVEETAKEAAEKTKEAAKEVKEKVEEAAEEVTGEGEEKEGEKEPEGPEPTVLVTNLETPTGVAVHEATGHVFVASRYGIYRYDPKGHAVSLEIAGYPKDVYGKGPKYDIGPLGLDFMGADMLVVGDGSRPDNEEVVRIYQVKNEPAENPMDEAKDAKFTLGPLKPDAEVGKGEGNFYDVAVGENSIFVSANGDDTKGWVLEIPIEDGKPTELKPGIATKELVGVDAPVPVELSKDGKTLYVGQMGEINLPGDALLLAFDAESKELKKKYELGLSDPAGLAISPKTDKMYVTDFAWAEPDNAGLFEVMIDGDEVTTKKVLSLDKPAGIAFDKDGRLFVCVVGTADESKKASDGKPLSPGTLIVIDAGL
ncbi:YncE family protein [Stratiformator vulcanicus]|uniref:SMP-30/Gluconolaconase/LRE-like region n=1 Tax=Stratiformator vulcanicus TaxID=2527980 RepID=A0A517R3V4_9PLAN|nr:hypothetical protein [Stratiformator vulcanicus]QDT38546.1 SMP-30/Gluconolaconase/LRE-like region [Stratiformator vulcanicus]